MVYPHKLYANVLLLDGKVINWKTGNTTWDQTLWMMNRQPGIVNKAVLSGEGDRLCSSVFTTIVNNTNENNIFFAKTSKEFYKMFEISEDFDHENMFAPY